MAGVDLGRLRAYRQVGSALHTAGQPSRLQLQGLGEAGIANVINLALADSDHAVADEADVLAAQGVVYHHQPIEFSTPGRDDLNRFSATLAACEDRPVLVHCALNMRVSAMVFLDRIERQGMMPAQALPDLLAIWTPEGPWRALIDTVLSDNGHAPLPE